MPTFLGARRIGEDRDPKVELTFPRIFGERGARQVRKRTAPTPHKNNVYDFYGTLLYFTYYGAEAATLCPGFATLCVMYRGRTRRRKQPERRSKKGILCQFLKRFLRQ